MEPAQYEIHASVEDRHWWWRARRDILRRVLARFAPRPEGRALRLAEIGCGTGGNLPMLSTFGEVLGAEADASALGRLRAKHGERFRVVQHAIPEPLPGRFDVIALFDVLEHIEDDAGALRWVAEHLEPSGIAVVTVPALDALWTEQDEAVHHLRRYSPARLEAVVPPELERVHGTFFNTLLFGPIFAARAGMRLLPRRPGSPRSHLGIPPAPLNALLYRIFRMEAEVVPRTRLPIGVSLLSVLRRAPPT